MPETVQSPRPEDRAAGPALLALLAPLPPPVALRLRTLANAWQGGGGTIVAGRLSIRLMANGPDGRPFTAGTLHPDHGRPGRPTLELARVLLQGHGVSEAAWRDWCDERPELRALGFSGSAKFPLVHLDAIPDAALARLAGGLRDLARAVAPAPTS